MGNNYMNRWLKIIFPPGEMVASVPLVFLSISLIALFQFPAQLLMKAGYVLSGIVFNEVVAIAGVPLALIAILRFDARRLLPFKSPALAVFLSVVVMTFGADIIIDYLTAASGHFFPLPDNVKDTYEKLMAVSGTGDIVWKLLILCALPSVCEEIFFRGFCQTSLSARWGDKIAIVVSALIFALLHGNPWYLHLYFILGLVIGWIFHETGSLWAAILCHFLNNAWTFLNHARGFRLPIEIKFGMPDTLILIAGVFVFLAGAIFLRKNIIGHHDCHSRGF